MEEKNFNMKSNLEIVIENSLTMNFIEGSKLKSKGLETVENVIKELNDNVFKDILKRLVEIYYWSSLLEGSFEYWVLDIYYLYHYIPICKGGYLSQKIIFDTIWKAASAFDEIEQSLNFDVQYAYSSFFPTIHIEDKVKTLCKNYFYWLSKKLSSNGAANMEDIFDKVHELVKETKAL